MEIKGITDIGQIRSSNQDSFYIDTNGKWCVVADGMGGHNGGETASKIAVETVKENMIGFDKDDFSEKFRELCQKANTAIYNAASEDESLYGMGTTIVLCGFSKNKATVAHIGDSRAYLLSGNKLKRITRDHSVVQDLLDNGTITEEQAKVHPQKNYITRAVGTDKDVEPDISTLTFKKNDSIIICSDGLTSMVDDSAILEISRDNSPGVAVQKLAALANIKGGTDNITVVIARM